MDVEMTDRLRQIRPLVVNYSNFVTPFLVANGLSAIGSSPIMSDEVAEAHDIAQVAHAIAINAGAAERGNWPLMETLSQSANERHIPLVLDPVAVGATTYRQELNRHLLADYSFSAIRGNVGEIAVLAGIDWETRGIDAGSGAMSAAKVARTCAQKYHTVVIASGETDYISDGTHTVAIHNQSGLLPMIVGSGDLLTSMVAAFQGALPDDPFTAAQLAVLELTIAGEIATQALDYRPLPGSFYIQLLDALALITPQQIRQQMKVEVLS